MQLGCLCLTHGAIVILVTFQELLDLIFRKGSGRDRRQDPESQGEEPGGEDRRLWHELAPALRLRTSSLGG